MAEDDAPSRRMFVDYPYSEALGRLHDVPDELQPSIGHDWTQPTWRDKLGMLVIGVVLAGLLWLAVYFGFRLASAWVAPWV